MRENRFLIKEYKFVKFFLTNHNEPTLIIQSGELEGIDLDKGYYCIKDDINEQRQNHKSIEGFQNLVAILISELSQAGFIELNRNKFVENKAFFVKKAKKAKKRQSSAGYINRRLKEI